jgi:ATP-binding protein involved in chromosome partitioning
LRLFMGDKVSQKAAPCTGDCQSCSSNEKGTRQECGKKVSMDVRHVILVLSGKGGVGKSTVSVNLAFALANRGYHTGLLDLDIHGPNVPKMLGLEDHRLTSLGDKILPARVTGNMAVISMAFLLPDPETPVIWRGPMKMAVIQQFLEDVDWGPLDFLVVDLPPGTGDEALSITQLAPNVAGAVIVTTPQDVSTLDSKKAITFVQKLGIPVIGIVENMSGMVCPHCHAEIDLFGKGGGKKIADEMKVPFLGSIPIDPEMRKSGDEGRPFIMSNEKNSTWESVDRVMVALVERIGG